MKKSVRCMPQGLLIILLFAITACGQSETATVKINVGAPLQARIQKPMIFDKILAFILLGGPAHADPAPGDWYDLSLAVEGPGMDTINESISPLTGEITLEVPAGSARKFTVVAIDDGWRRYGGIGTVDLSPGSSTTLNIYMGDLPNEPTFYGVGSPFPNQLYWYYSPPEPENIDGFKVYRSSVPEGPYSVIIEGRKEDFWDGFSQYVYSDEGGAESSYYKISATNAFGEGDMTNYFQYFSVC